MSKSRRPKNDTNESIDSLIARLASLEAKPVSLGVVATTSGTLFDFSGIPSTAKKITIAFNGVSSNAVSHIVVRLGNPGLVTSGYLSYYGIFSGSSTATAGITNGFGVWSNSAADISYGVMTIVRVGDTNQWTYSYSGGMFNASLNYGASGGGTVTLSSALSNLRITTAGGTATFDAGSVAVSYE